MRTPERALARKRRYRRRLRSRIILSFVIFGFGLTALIATTAVYLRNRVEDQVISAALVKNNNVFAEGFYRNPNAIGVPFEKIQGRQFSRSEEHTSELQSLMRKSYAVFCLKKKKQPNTR